MKFVHPLLNHEVDAIGGHYLISKEALLQDGNENILYFLGHAITDRTCCGTGGCGYAIIAGHVIAYRTGMNEDGRYVSEIMPVSKRRFEELTGMMKREEGVIQVHFLTSPDHYAVLF